MPNVTDRVDSGEAELRAPARTRSWRPVPGHAFVSGYFVLLVAFGIAPAVYALYLSVTDSGGGFAGLSNFVKTFQDYRFLPALGHVTTYLVLWLVNLSVFVLLLALLVHRLTARWSRAALRFVYYVPGALAGASSVLLWLFMLDPAVSPGEFLLRHLLGADLFVKSIAPAHLPYIFAIIAFWTGAGGWIVVMYGALNTIPHDLEEAARIDGAGPITIALRLKLPLIRKWIAYMLILSFATGTQLFVEPQVVQTASFGLVPDTWSANQLAYQLAFRYADFNGAAAIAVDLLMIGLVGAVLIVTRSGLFRTED
jgi:multiple sugar transport system permease protein